MTRYIGVLAQFAVLLAVIFIVGQAAILPVFDALSGVDNHDIKDQQGDVVFDTDEWMSSSEGVVFKWLPALVMVGLPAIAFFWYMRLTSATNRR